VSLTSLACAGGPAPRDHFYRLTVPEPPTTSRHAVPLFAGALEVERLRADPLVRGRAMLSSDGPESVEVAPYRFHFWVESPVVAIQRALVADLRARGIAEQVVPPEIRVAESWMVTGRLVRLEGIRQLEDNRVLVEVELGLVESRTGNLYWHATYGAERPADGPGAEGFARAIGFALAEVFESFAADLEIRSAAE
jgi:ABC-type uncharacterized transport system auxiliary subunit